MFLQSLLHSPRRLVSRYRRWLNKVSNLKIHRWFCGHCLVTWLLKLQYITGHGPENNLWFSINRPGRAVSCYLLAGRVAKVLADAVSIVKYTSSPLQIYCSEAVMRLHYQMLLKSRPPNLTGCHRPSSYLQYHRKLWSGAYQAEVLSHELHITIGRI